MKQARQEDLSLNHYIKNTVLSDFIETEYSVPLMYKQALSSAGSYVYEINTDMLPEPNSFGRGLAYIDNSYDTTEQTSSVIVYDSIGSVIDRSNYGIDYIDGRIITTSSNVVPDNITYRWHYVSVVNEWEYVQSVGTPAVSVDIAGFSKTGFQLGGGKFVPRTVNIHVFASNQGERDDLSEAIYDGVYLKCCPFQAFLNGTMLDWDGQWNDAYTYTTISGYSDLKFDKVQSRNIYPRLLTVPNRDVTPLSDINRYRSRITFDMIHWEET